MTISFYIGMVALGSVLVLAVLVLYCIFSLGLCIWDWVHNTVDWPYRRRLFNRKRFHRNFDLICYAQAGMLVWPIMPFIVIGYIIKVLLREEE